MTERELSQAVHLKAGLDAIRRVASCEPSLEVLKAIDRQARAVELARLEVMAFIERNRKILADGGPII